MEKTDNKVAIDVEVGGVKLQGRPKKSRNEKLEKALRQNLLRRKASQAGKDDPE